MLRFGRIALLPYLCLFVFVGMLAVQVGAQSTAPSSAQLSPTPPMGWNSWDAYGLTINEADFRANVSVLAGMKDLGWKYAVIDEGWYLQNPVGADTASQKFVYDAHGRLIPALNRFPSATKGAGLKPIADWVHGQGLKFGIHLIRGIPRESVAANKPIAGAGVGDSGFVAQDAADTSDVCPWNNDNYGIRDNAAGQAWYDSMIALYAGWGVDYLKVDCIADRPYKVSEIRQIALAIKKAGRPIVLSLSPGPTAVEHATEIAQYAQMWRISDDHWDVWSHVPKAGESEFPMGTLQAFSRLVPWRGYVGPGSWPDEDMLPLGYLGPHPGWGEARQSRFTEDESRTEFTLWAITRSPLILGGNLTKLDDFTRSLITNKAVLRMNQRVVTAHPVITLPPEWRKVRVWIASEQASLDTARYVAIFNLDDQPIEIRSSLEDLSPELRGSHLRDLWTGAEAAANGEVHVTLAPHASVLYLAQEKLPAR
jgi:alpha-galactosidase